MIASLAHSSPLYVLPDFSVPKYARSTSTESFPYVYNSVESIFENFIGFKRQKADTTSVDEAKQLSIFSRI